MGGVNSMNEPLRDSYPEVSNGSIAALHLTVDQHKRLQTAILEGLQDEVARRTHASVVGAAELAAILDDLPHLRSAFFATSAFRDWGRAFEALKRQSLPLETTGRLAPLIGRDRSIDHLRGLVDQGAVRAIVVTGPHMIG
jgi:hypothetical protein